MVAQPETKASGSSDGAHSAKRLGKLKEYLNEVEDQLFGQEACIGFISADLMLMAMVLREDFDQLCSLPLDPSDRSILMARIMDQMFRIAKQVNSLTATSLQLERRKQRAAEPKAIAIERDFQQLIGGKSANMSYMPVEKANPSRLASIDVDGESEKKRA